MGESLMRNDVVAEFADLEKAKFLRNLCLLEYFNKILGKFGKIIHA